MRSYAIAVPRGC